MSTSAHFPDYECMCSCGCGKNDAKPDLLNFLEVLREACGFSLPISSMYRCPDHNDAVSSTGRDGPHTSGLAADIAVSGHKAHKVLTEAMRLGASGVGISQKGPHDSRFIHVDLLARNETKGPRPWVWGY